jgi:osmotically-inducible protein OsmY
MLRHYCIFLVILSFLSLDAVMINLASAASEPAKNITEQKIQSLLRADKELSPFSISIVSNQANIELNGVVDTAAQKQKIMEIACHMQGIRVVTDGLSVKTKK